MNQLARDMLRAAWLRGQKQVTETLVEEGGDGLCAMGVLGFVLVRTLDDLLANFSLYGKYDMDYYEENMLCPVCDRKTRYARVIAHLNDVHRLDFNKIAEIMP